MLQTKRTVIWQQQ